MELDNLAEEGSHTNNNKSDFLVVGIGASAGGVEALQTFFENVPEKSGIAYVVILHLSPDYDSQLTSVLRNITAIRVVKLTERTKIEPDTIYVVSPNYHLSMNDGHIEVSPNILIEERRAPVDIFFRTLAETHMERAVCVVLSGTGANGSMGLKRVKERGGAAFVQNPREAQFSEMPRNSIATDLVDGILKVAEIPERIIAYRDNLGKIEIVLQPEKRPEDDQQALREIFTQLRVRTGHDFSNYKRATILRRIQRRLSVRDLPNLLSYAEYLHKTPEEAHALLKDLLISVTNFFRDKASFDFLNREIIPRLLEGKNNDATVRVWIAGCATGEEAYSLAMMLAERTLGNKDAPKIQLFASDIDEQAISTAREGFYTLNDAADISPERLRRFFHSEAEGYRVNREIREMILFANHNLIKDPPFSHVDLITCRNLLIYFNSTAQERVMETVHFSLNPGGYFFIGNSESVNGATDLFMQVSKEANVYQSRPIATRMAYPVPDSVPSFRFTKDNPAGELAPESRENRTRERITYGELHQNLLEQYAPPSLVVNEEYEIVHLSEKAGRYLQVSGGELSQNLLKLVRPELRLVLRTALYQAVQQQTNVRTHNLQVRIDDRTEYLDIHVRPVLTEKDAARGFILVMFEAVTREVPEANVTYASPEPVARQLEEELIRVKSQLRDSAEQFEVQAEELKASNEELQAMNEELRSAAEELETSKEELQSINEELITVNQELKVKIEELSQTNNNFQNLVNSADIPTIFLDRHFRVNMFTPAAQEIFNLMPFDTGRPISDITSRLSYKELINDVAFVLQKLQSVEREVTTTEDKTYLLRITPYRTSEDRISGVVITFVDITARKRAEDAMRAAEERMRLANEAADIYTWEYYVPTGQYSFSANAATILGIAELPLTIEDTLRIVHPEDKIMLNNTLNNAIEKGIGFTLDIRSLKQTGVTVWLNISTTIVKDKEGNTSHIVGIAQDVSKRRKAEQLLANSEERLRLAVMAGNIGTCDWNYQTGEMQWNDVHSRMYGMEPIDRIVMADESFKFICKEDLEETRKSIREGVEQTGKHAEEYRIIHSDGSTHWITETGRVVEWTTEGKPLRIISVLFDITEQRRAQEVLRESEERYRIALEAGELATWDWNLVTNRVQWNEQHFRLFGITNPTELGIEPEYFLEFIYPEDVPYVKKELAEVVGKTGIYQAEFRITREDNKQIRWMCGYGRVTERVNGNPTRISGVMYDSTNRRQAQEKLKETQNSLTAALEATQMGVWDLDFAAGYVNHSTRHDQLLGYKFWQEDWSTEKAKQYIMEEDKWKFDAAYQNLLNKGVFELEARVKNEEDSVCWVYYYGRTFTTDQKKSSHAAGVIYDITDRKIVEQKKDEFIGIASHELKTPVTSIKAYAEILHDHFLELGDDNAVQYLAKLNSQVERLARLIRDLLDATRIAEGRLNVNESEININELLQEIVEELQRTTQKHTIELALQPLTLFRGDTERLQQVFINLLSNALKYSPNANKIIVSTYQNETHLNIAVKDFGIGINEEALNHLFERFYRSANPNITTFPGLGLGLYISNQLIRLHNGAIAVQSEVDKGSTFTVLLPKQS